VERIGGTYRRISTQENKRGKVRLSAVRSGKSKNAKRTISLTARVSEMLRSRMAGNESRVGSSRGKGRRKASPFSQRRSTASTVESEPHSACPKTSCYTPCVIRS
jgi:hypothetical protein